MAVYFAAKLCNYRHTNSWQLIASLSHVCQQRRHINISRNALRDFEQLIGKRHGSQNSLWYLQPPAVIPPSWQTCLVRHTSAGDRRATNLPTDCARLPACGEGVRESFVRLCSIGIVQKRLRRWLAGWPALWMPLHSLLFSYYKNRRVKILWAIFFLKFSLGLTQWGRVTQICVFNTRLFSLHNTLNYAIHRVCLRMVLLTDVYRKLTSLWINLQAPRFLYIGTDVSLLSRERFLYI